MFRMNDLYSYTSHFKMPHRFVKLDFKKRRISSIINFRDFQASPLKSGLELFKRAF